MTFQTGAETLWDHVRQQAEKLVANEPVLACYVQKAILDAPSFSRALIEILASHGAGAGVEIETLHDLFLDVHEQEPELEAIALYDLAAVLARDPAEPNVLTPFLYFKGFHAIQTHRISHWLWNKGRRHLGFYLQSRSSLLYGVDIHPAARLGRGIMFDHATGVVIGETAVVEDDVSLLHGVTLGGTGKEKGDRHPKIRRGVMVGAGATILGNIEIGQGASVAAGSVVLKSVPPRVTVAGVPAQIVGTPRHAVPAFEMDQTLPD